MNKLIINFAPTGMVPDKSMTPFVPISPDEIIEETHQAYEEGITIVHLHARDDEGVPIYKKEIYEEIFTGIRKHAPDLVICVSLSGRNFTEFEKRSEVLQLKPDMGSLTLSSLNFPKQASVNSPEIIRRLADEMTKQGVHPELEVFDLGMMNYAHYLIHKNVLKAPYYFNIILGNIAGMQTDLLQIGVALKELPEKSYWALGGIGGQQLKAASIAIASGGGVRIGLEDNIYYDKGKKRLATNIDLIKRVKLLAEIHERELMKPKEFGDLGFYNQFG